MYIQSDSTGGGTDSTPQFILILTHQGAAPDRRRSLISTIALFLSILTTNKGYLLGSGIALFLSINIGGASP